MHPQGHVDSGRPETKEGEKNNKVVPVIQLRQPALDFVVIEQVSVQDFLRVHLV